jgi:membrane protein implicated in regulation of membrane protease activity
MKDILFGASIILLSLGVVALFVGGIILLLTMQFLWAVVAFIGFSVAASLNIHILFSDDEDDMI